MVELVRAGGNPDDVAREFEPSGHSIRAWVAQADRNEGRREEAAPSLSAFERDELTRLRRENKQLRLERDILSKAAAWFARETGTLPSGSSGHEREPGRLPDCRDGTRARRVQGGLLCLAATATVRPRHGRRGLV
jgi:transposase